MIKKVEDWNFTETQAYSKGYLIGFVWGLVMTLNILSLGVSIYLINR